MTTLHTTELISEDNENLRHLLELRDALMTDAERASPFSQSPEALALAVTAVQETIDHTLASEAVLWASTEQ